MLPRMAARGEFRSVHRGAPGIIRALSMPQGVCFLLGSVAFARGVTRSQVRGRE